MNARESQDALKVIGIIALFVLLATIFVYISSKHLSLQQQIIASAVAVGLFIFGQAAQSRIIGGEAAA